MKVKVIITLIVLLAACQEQQNLVPHNLANEPWTITWQIKDQATYGTIYLNNNHEARVIIQQPDYLFFSQPEDVRFHWNVTSDQFILTRVDNGFKMTYKIVEQQDNYYQLSLDEELIVKIYR